MTDIIIVAIVIIIIGFAARYIIRAKKSGQKCIGCSACEGCVSKNTSCGDCSACGCADAQSDNVEK